MDYVPLIQSGITAAGVLLAAVIAASLAVRSYRKQKNLDRKQEQYESYIRAFMAANFWGIRESEICQRQQPKSWARYHQLQLESRLRYDEVFESLLLVASKEVHDRATDFHRCYLKGDVQNRENELKTEYAKMVVAMREDGFEKGMSVQEAKKRITWEA